jgi:hypothetical protein
MLLSRSLLSQNDRHRLVLIDGDKVEAKNLDRQYYGRFGVGKPKPVALARNLTEAGVPSYQVHACPTYVTDDMRLAPAPNMAEALTLQACRKFLETADVIICAVDNHPARRTLVELAVRTGAVLIVAANELTDSEAWWYHRGLPQAFHPFTRIPELMTDVSDDPTKPGCVGAEAGAAGGQLAHANFLAAGMAVHLMQFLGEEGGPLHGGSVNRDWKLGDQPLFIAHRCNFSRFQTEVHAHD